MTAFKLILFFLIISTVSCGQKQIKQQTGYKVNAEAIKLNEQIIPLVNYYEDIDSSKKALSLLDSATAIDNNCYSCYYNKLMFLNTLERFDKMDSTLESLIRLRPNDHTLYLMRGKFYEQQRDTASSKKDFQKSLEICQRILDTMSLKNPGYDPILLDRALNLIMLNKHEEGNQLLKRLCDKQKDELFKNFYCSYLNKSKSELLVLEPPNESQAESVAVPDN